MSEKADLRYAQQTIKAVKGFAERMFGFNSYLVEPLEADGRDPGIYCMFEVCGVEYQVSNGKLSIYAQGGRDE